MVEKKIKKNKGLTESKIKKDGINTNKKTKRPSKPEPQRPKKSKKIKKIETTRKAKQTHIIPCTNCGMEMQVDLSVVTVLCSNCTMVKTIKLYGLPKGCVPQKERGIKMPPGWHFYKEFVDKNGKVYHKGIEQPKLFGTMGPTIIKPKKKSKQISIREKEKKQREIFKEIQRSKSALHRLVRDGRSRGQKGLTKKIQKLKREVRKYL